MTKMPIVNVSPHFINLFCLCPTLSHLPHIPLFRQYLGSLHCVVPISIILPRLASCSPSSIHGSFNNNIHNNPQKSQIVEGRKIPGKAKCQGVWWVIGERAKGSRLLLKNRSFWIADFASSMTIKPPRTSPLGLCMAAMLSTRLLAGIRTCGHLEAEKIWTNNLTRPFPAPLLVHCYTVFCHSYWSDLDQNQDIVACYSAPSSPLVSRFRCSPLP